MDKGHFTIASRVYLTAAERTKLEQILRRDERELDVLLSDLLRAYIEQQPEPPPEPMPDASESRNADLARRRSELRRLRPKLNDPYNPPPDWLIAMVAELEAEIRRLEATS